MGRGEVGKGLEVERELVGWDAGGTSGVRRVSGVRKV